MSQSRAMNGLPLKVVSAAYACTNCLPIMDNGVVQVSSACRQWDLAYTITQFCPRISGEYSRRAHLQDVHIVCITGMAEGVL
jgi:hypothetical protein